MWLHALRHTAVHSMSFGYVCSSIVVYFWLVYLHGMTKASVYDRRRESSSMAAYGRAPNLLIHIWMCITLHAGAYCGLAGETTTARGYIIVRFQFPASATATAPCMHARRSRAQLWPGTKIVCGGAATSKSPPLAASSNNRTEAIRPSVLLAGTSSSHACSAAGISVAAIRSIGCGSCRAPAKHARPRSQWHAQPEF